MPIQTFSVILKQPYKTRLAFLEMLIMKMQSNCFKSSMNKTAFIWSWNIANPISKCNASINLKVKRKPFKLCFKSSKVARKWSISTLFTETSNLQMFCTIKGCINSQILEWPNIFKLVKITCFDLMLELLIIWLLRFLKENLIQRNVIFGLQG